MYLLGFIVALIILLAIIISPILMKKLLKIKYFKGFFSGICCAVFCIIFFFCCFIIWALLVSKYVESHKNDLEDIIFLPSFPELLFHFPKTNVIIEYFYLIMYIVSDISFFLLIMFFVLKLIGQIKSSRQIFMFISGFNLAFILPFTMAMLTGLEWIGYGEEYYEKLPLQYLGVSYHSLLLCFEFFVLSYLFQLTGVILIVFLWVRNKKRLFLLIAIGTLFGPFIIFIISFHVQIRIISDLFTPLTYYVAFVIGINFYLKRDNNNESLIKMKLLPSSSQN